MKNKIKLLLIGLIIVPFLNSCDDTEEIIVPDAYDESWVDSANLEFIPQGEDSNFVYNINQSTGDEFWGTTELTFDVDFYSDIATVADIAKIDIYGFLEEEVNGSFNYLGGNSGRLITSIVDPTENTQITLTKEMVYDLFENEFSLPRTDIIPGDLFEFKWVITGRDNTNLDTREGCRGFNCTFGFLAETKIVDTWIGEFDYNWIEVGADTVIYSWAQVGSNPQGTVLFSPTDTDGVYEVNDLSFGGSYGAARPGTIAYDQDTNILTVTDDTFWANNWELVSATDEVLTIKWTYYYSQWYSENGTVELGRSDGLTWPENLTIVNN